MSKSKKPYSITAGTLLDKAFKPREWLIQGLIRQRQLALVFAPSGVGKTWFVWSLACMIAGGGHGMHRYSNDKPRKVLIIDGEMDGEDAQERIRVGMQSVHANPEVMRENLTILSRQMQSLEAEFPNLDEVEWQRRIVDKMVNNGTEVVILDNLSTLLQVEDENSSAALDRFTDFLLLLKRAGIGAIVVHHSNKAGTSYRGSQKISVTFDAILKIERPAGASTSHTCIEVEFDKARSLRDTVPFRLSLKDSVWVSEESDAEAKMAWAALNTGKYKTYQELADGLELPNRQKAQRWIEKAIKAGMVTTDGVLAAFRRAKYELKETELEEEELTEPLDF